MSWLKTGEIRYEDIFSTAETITREALKASPAKLIPASTLVMAMKGQGATRGRVAVVRREMAMNEACAAFIPNEPMDVRYLFHWFASQYDAIREHEAGTSQPNLNKELVSAFPVLLPSLAEQQVLGRNFDILLNAARASEREAVAAEQLGVALRDELIAGSRGILTGSAT